MLTIKVCHESGNESVYLALGVVNYYAADNFILIDGDGGVHLTPGDKAFVMNSKGSTISNYTFFETLSAS